jgi:hypothetical protein
LIFDWQGFIISFFLIGGNMLLKINFGTFTMIPKIQLSRPGQNVCSMGIEILLIQWGIFHMEPIDSASQKTLVEVVTIVVWFSVLLFKRELSV